jgi:O-antigen/teichoic acid export membrane protein
MIVQIGVNILGNYLISLKVNKLFPYVRDSVPRLEKSYKISVFRNAMHMLLIRIGATLINSTDNLIISALISTVLVGIYSNYSMIVQIILTTVFLVETAMSASVGNLCANSSCQRKYEIFLRIRFLYTCMFCFISVCLYVLLNPFVEMWIGQQYLLSKTTVLLIVINCYLSGIRQPIEVYITADGLFRHFTLKPLVEVVINLVISIVGARLYGINGVLLGTTISHVATTLWFDAFVVYKYSFKEKLSKYFLLLLKGGCCTALIMGLADGVVNCIGMKGVKGFIISICVCIISSVFVLPFYSRNNEFKWWVKMIKRN